MSPKMCLHRSSICSARRDWCAFHFVVPSDWSSTNVSCTRAVDPFFKEVMCMSNASDVDHLRPLANVYPVFKQSTVMGVLYRDRYNQRLEYPLQFHFQSLSTDARTPNQSAMWLLNGEHTKPWPGTIVVLRFASSDCRRYLDFRDEDVGLVRDFLLCRADG